MCLPAESAAGLCVRAAQVKRSVFYPRSIGIELVRSRTPASEALPAAADARQSSAPYQFMSLDLLQDIVAEIDRWPTVEAISLAGFGEPLLHPEYPLCLEILSRSQVAGRAHVTQAASASVLGGAPAQAILETPIVNSVVVLSFDGGAESGYECLSGPCADGALRHLRAFVEAAKSRRSDLLLTAEVTLPASDKAQGLQMPPPEVARAAMQDIFAPIGVQVSIRPFCNRRGKDGQQLSGCGSDAVRGGCAFVEDDSVYFTAEGLAQPCSVVFDPEFNIGRIQESDLGSLLNSEQMRLLRRRLRLDKRPGLPYCGNCPISLAGELNERRLREYWIRRDDMGMIDESDVREHIFGSVVPTAHRVRRLDLGSGPAAQPGFIAVDRFRLEGVDVVADFDVSLPFHDDTFDLILASHSLEHAANLPSVMREVYRVAKDRAQVCIVAPYYLTSVNLSNPYHRQAFTEETPRFWTDSPTAARGMDEATARHVVPSWGLIRSDQSHADIDLRCMRIQFSYFPEYRSLPEDEQRRLRHTQLNVCDQIMYHLLVVKSPLADGEEEELMKQMQYYEPPYVMIRDRQEHIDALLARLDIAWRETEAAEGERARLAASLEAETRERADLHAREIEANAALGEIPALRAAAERLSDELEEAGASRLIRWLRRMRPGPDLRGRLTPDFQQFLDDSLIFSRGMERFVLRPSRQLREGVFLPYHVALDRTGWCGIDIAPLVDVGGSGEIAFEVVSPQKQIIGHVRLSLSDVKDLRPLHFEFDPIADSDRGSFEVRIGVSGSDTRVRVLEWRRGVFAGARPPDRRPFCAFHFEEGVSDR